METSIKLTNTKLHLAVEKRKYLSRNDSGDINNNLTKIKRILREPYEQLYNNKLDNLDEIGEFLERYKLPKQSQEEIENLNRTITSKKLN